MGFWGGLLDRGLGAIGSKLLPIKGLDGQALGGVSGRLAPFKNGGAVRKKKRVILVHPNEYVLLANAKPTKAQKAIVAKNKKDNNGKK